MKILFILPSYEPAWTYGGVVRATYMLCRGLVAQGNEVTVYTTNTSGTDTPLDVPLNQEVDLGGVKVCYFRPSFSQKANFFSRSLIQKLRETATQFDIVYSSAIWQWLGIATATICQTAGIPLVIGIHGSFDKQLRKRGFLRKNIFRLLFLNRALKRARALHLTTNLERQEAEDWLMERPSFIVPNAVDENAFYQIPESRQYFRQLHHIPESARVAIAVGRPDWKKRVDLVISALVDNPNWYLVVVCTADEGMAPSWKASAEKLGVSNRVVWTGYLSENLLAAYSAADLFVLISESENFGMVVVEALLCSLPILVSEQGGAWEMLQDTDVGIATSLNSEDISIAMKDFAKNNEKWKNRGKKARLVAIEKFSSPKISQLMQQAFEDIISEKVCINN